jgi:hypothetical protein
MKFDHDNEGREALSPHAAMARAAVDREKRLLIPGPMPSHDLPILAEELQGVNPLTGESLSGQGLADADLK